MTSLRSSLLGALLDLAPGRAELRLAVARCGSTSGIALSCLGLLSGLCVVAQDAPPAVIATLLLYNLGACANNAVQRGGAMVALVHAALAAGLFVTA